MAEFAYEDLLPTGPDRHRVPAAVHRGVTTVEGPGGRTFLQVEPEALRLLTDDGHARHRALPAPGAPRPARAASSTTRTPRNNDRFVALDLLKNANIAAGGVLPMCQDTGTAIVMGKRGQHVLTEGERRGAPSPAASSTPTPGSTCATRRWRR